MPRKTSMPSNRRSSALMKVSIFVTITLVTVYFAIRLFLHTETNRDTVALVIAVPVLALLILTVFSFLRIPKPSVPKLPKTDDRHERIIMRRLSPRRWERAVIDARLSFDDRSDIDHTLIQTPRITAVKAVPLGLSLTVQAISGQSPEEIKNRIPNLASALAVPLIFRSIGARTVEVIAKLREPLDEVIKIDVFPDLNVSTMSVDFGVREDGRPAVWTCANQGGGVVGGVPGSGKTVWSSLLVGALLMSSSADVHIIDGKGGADWFWARSRAASYSRETEDLAAVADQIVGIDSQMKERLASITEDQESNFWSRKPSPDEPFVILVIDECQTYLDGAGLSKEDKAEVARMTAAIANLTKKGRSAGFFIMLMTQKPTAESIPTKIRDNCGPRICFQVTTRAAEESVLGVMADNVDDPARAALIPLDRIGGAVMADEAGRRIYVRSAFLPEKTASTIIQGVPA